METEQLKEIIRLHGLWLVGDPAGKRANLSLADLSGAYLSRANLSRADLSWANLSGANLSGADLSWADMKEAYGVIPAMMLMASWGNVSQKLTTDLMNYDAANHPNSQAFTDWVNGGNCPYRGQRVIRACNFAEYKSVWNPNAPLCRPYDLMIRLFKEKEIQWE